MIEKIVTPRMGEGVTQVNVIRWLKQTGDEIHEYEPLVEVETDKVATEIPSPVNGRLSGILIPAGEVAQVGDILAEIETDAIDEIEAIHHSQISLRKHPRKFPMLEMPNLPETAREDPRSQLDFADCGKNCAKKTRSTWNRCRGTGLNRPDHQTGYLDISATRTSYGDTSYSCYFRSSFLPITSIRRQIAEHLQHSIQTAPHVLTVMESDLSLVLEDISIQKGRIQSPRGKPDTYSLLHPCHSSCTQKQSPGQC